MQGAHRLRQNAGHRRAGGQAADRADVVASRCWRFAVISARSRSAWRLSGESSASTRAGLLAARSVAAGAEHLGKARAVRRVRRAGDKTADVAKIAAAFRDGALDDVGDDAALDVARIGADNLSSTWRASPGAALR